MAITKNITTNKQDLLEGINAVYKAVLPTFGPDGKMVIIKTQFNEIVVTKDGVTVARNIKLNDIEGMGVNLITSPSLELNREVGDGTSSVVILTKHLIDLGFKYNELNINDIKEAVKKLTKQFNFKEAYDIALIASNKDENISKTISDIYKDYEGNVHIILENGYLEDAIESKKGWFAETGFISPYPVNNYTKFAVELSEKVDVLIFPDKLHNPRIVMEAIEKSRQKNNKLLIMTEDINKDMLMELAKSYRQNIMWTAVGKMPGFGEMQYELAEDLAKITGGEVYTNSKVPAPIVLGEATGVYLDNKKIVIATDNKDKIEDLINTLREKLKTVTNAYVKKKTQERIKNILGGVAIIHVGGETDKDRKERYLRYEDAVSAVKAAEKGIILGGGHSYFSIAKMMKNKKLRLAVCRMLKDLYRNKNYSEEYFCKLTAKQLEKRIFKDRIVKEPAILVEKVLTTATTISGIVNDSEVILYNEKEKTDIEIEDNE